MPRFGRKSRANLSTCDQQLQDLFNEVIKHVDCSVLEGHRDEEGQNKAYDAGYSKVRFPDGKHNSSPSRAVDVTPWPVRWNERERQTLFAGFCLGMATRMGVRIRWGGDWDEDYEGNDNKFDDFPHFELK